MARKAKDKSKSVTDSDTHLNVIMSVVVAALGVLFVLAPFGLAGVAGNKIYSWIRYLVGVGYILLPLLSFSTVAIILKSLHKSFRITKIVAVFVILFSTLGLIEAIYAGNGGLIGRVVSKPLISLFDIYATNIILITLSIVATVFAFEKFFSISNLKDRFIGDGNEDIDSDDEADEEEELKLTPESAAALEVKESGEIPDNKKSQETSKNKTKSDELDLLPAKEKMRLTNYVPFPLSILESDKGKPGVGDIKANANIIRRTLHNFGITVEMDEVSIGPSVTRYALKPAEGVKLSRIVGLQNDLSLALAAHPIRIEAPIPGKSLVGIEIPNTTKTTVGLATILSSPDYVSSNDKPLTIALGKGISGKPHFANLAKMPHLLIAGATGSGKSVTIHSIITSLLYRNSPDDLKFIMIDPKRVELTLYNKIPHLLTPVITDPKKAILALKWAGKEMDRRYDILESETVRDIQSYHKNIVEPEYSKDAKKKSKSGDSDDSETKLPESMPYIIIVIDELADIMQAYPRELESAIVRLAQMSRAVGIHLILSTQRPSVNVITGLIKANVPSRIALQVISQIDSRTILDTGGAEKLLGAGDMLYLGGEMSKPQRIQSPYITETEVKTVTKYLSDNYTQEETLDTLSMLNNPSDGNTNDISSIDSDSMDDDDDLYEDARIVVIEAGKASTSYIQRKMRVGYARAARLIDLLEERGVIGPGDGAKPREILDGGFPSNDNPESEMDNH